MIIDTNIYSALMRNDPQVVAHIASTTVIGLPFVVIAELRAGFLSGNRNEINLDVLERFLKLPEVKVYDAVQDYVTHYADLYQYSKQQGRLPGVHDIWIAAAAAYHNDQLLTYDQNFAVFQDRLGDNLVILNHS